MRSASQACSFIKIDVDGKELEVLRSANGLMEKMPADPLFRKRRPGEIRLHCWNTPWRSATTCISIRRRYSMPNNFFGNPTNHWAPNNILSFMILGIPSERRSQYTIQLRPVPDKDAWWDQAINMTA